MNANQRSKLQNRIDAKQRLVSQLETRLQNASGVFKKKVADQLAVAKQELAKMKEELRQGSIADRENLAEQQNTSLKKEKAATEKRLFEEANTVDETIEDIEGGETPVELGDKSTEELTAMYNDPNTRDEVKVQIKAKLDSFKNQQAAGDDQGAFNITSAGILEQNVDGQWVPYTGEYQGKEYTNGVAPDGVERVGPSDEFGTEEAVRIEEENKQLDAEINQMIANAEGFINSFNSATSVEDLESLNQEALAAIAKVRGA